MNAPRTLDLAMSEERRLKPIGSPMPIGLRAESPVRCGAAPV
jgi:hypothetical protein